MRYYTLTTSTDINKIGFYPQTDLSEESEFFSPFSTFLPKISIIPDKIPKYKIIINDSAIPTDIIERIGVSYGLVLNETLKTILESKNLPDNKFFPIEVMWQNKLLDYYWFHSYDNIFQYIDMSLSQFTVRQYNDVSDFYFNSEAFFYEKKMESMNDFTKTFMLKKIYFLDKFPKYDLFTFENLTLISEKLLNIFQENNINGYEAKLYEILEFDNV